MNHKPRQPRQGPPPSRPQQPMGRPGHPHPPQQGMPPMPPPGQQGGPRHPGPGNMPPPHPGMPPNGNNFNNRPTGRGMPPPGRPAPPGQQPNPFRAEDISPPFRPQKPIPASVPNVDADAIAAALNQCSNELDVLERTGQVTRGRPEPIDDLIVVDMYTPKEKIPSSKRHIAAQVIARQGPAEEGEGMRQNDLINALRSSPQPIQPEPHGPGTHDQIIAHTEAVHQELPEPTLFTPENKQNTPQQSTKSGVSENMLDAFEAAVFGEEPSTEAAKNTNKPEQKERETGDLSQGEFSSRLMPENNAYRITREDAPPANFDEAMNTEDLHALYAAQKAETEAGKTNEPESFLFDNNPTNSSGGGFLSGLGGGNQSQQNNLPDSNEGLVTSGGFLSGLENGGPDQNNAFASRRDAFDKLPDYSGTKQENTASASGFLQGLGGNPSSNTTHQAPVLNTSYNSPPGGSILQPEPGFSAVWQGDNISPEAKAYRDQALFGGSQPPSQHQQNINNHQPPHPAFLQQGMPQGRGQSPYNGGPVQSPPGMGQSPMGGPQVTPGSPSFLSKPSLSKETPEQKTDKPSKPVKPKRRAGSEISKEEKRRRKAIRAYFGDRPLWSLFTATAGLITMATQYRYDPIREWVKPEMTWYLAAGAAIFLLSIMWRYLSVRKPKEESLDDWIAEDLVNLEKRALQSMQLNNRYLLLEPVVMSGFPDLDNLNDDFVNGLYGKDHILRYTPRALTVMCFTREEIITYEGAINITTGEIAYETTREFFYADIATIGLIKEKVRSKLRLGTMIRPWKWGIVERIMRMLSGRPVDKTASRTKETFLINLKDGTKVQVILRDGRVLRDRAFEEIPLSTDDKVLDAIKEFVVAQKTDQLAGIR